MQIHKLELKICYYNREEKPQWFDQMKTMDKTRIMRIVFELDFKGTRPTESIELSDGKYKEHHYSHSLQTQRSKLANCVRTQVFLVHDTVLPVRPDA
jgi:hypothetical protein